MCGRFSLIQVKDLEKRFEFEQIEFEFEPRYNIAPSQQVPGVLRQNGRNRLCMFRWGLIPNWAKDERIGNKMINARGETLKEKQSFRKSLEQRRCLVLADGFYEWKREGRVKKPYRITLHDGRPFAFAGLWDSWLTPAGQRVNSCTIVTTSSNTLMETIHQRMPVILPQKNEALWLNVDVVSGGEAQSLLTPYPAEQMDAYEVLPLVNSPSYEGPECVIGASSLF
ncbi:hypothetical protein Desaci_0400 [Desulfosporosinus acidiphilus SJ4]|uniref:Abasic site processing protein n=1 Tax=Desulfosporosinus acidiphilus (strain DSM 22704 / JCM 16185 / SJ4) TaxID=646529 RepID=I4D0Z3_DESAJ|nr:SOS response-associated peptidase [Desulfosporosinus acidiphilus]AFM39467.1 hypothetical protein Desaci_0400 [Desulfosporosinus acidiphilus SJ4]